MESDEVTITKEEWKLLKQVMRTLTWGKRDASDPWYKLVDSVESRFPKKAVFPTAIASQWNAELAKQTADVQTERKQDE